MANGSFKCLIGVDGSEGADEAFNFYLQHIHRPEHELLLLYVVPPLVISSNEMALYLNGIRERNLIEEKSKVKQLKEIYEEKMRSNGVHGKINVIYYSKKPGKILCELAVEEKCSLILLGCPKIRSSSTNDYVLKKAPCSVMITRLHLDGKSLNSPTSPSSSVHYDFPSGSKLMVPTGDDRPQRRISCPVVTSPLSAALLSPGGEQVDGKDVEIETGAVAGVEAAGGWNVQKPRPRRHSTVANVFQNLSHHFDGSGRKKLLKDKDTKC